MTNKKSILIIGGTGTISSSLTQLIIQRNEYDLYLLHRKSPSNPNELKYKYIQGDINDKQIQQQLQTMQFDIVIDFICFNKIDAQRDVDVFKNNCSQFIFISTAATYNQSNYPHTENTSQNQTQWKYAQMKYEAEQLFIHHFQNENFPLTIVRPSHTYCDKKIPTPIHGKIGTYQILERMKNNKPIIIHGDGTSLWTFTHADDFVKGLYGVLGKKECIGETYHVTSDEVLNWNEWCLLLGKVWGYEVKICHVPTDILIHFDESLKGQMMYDKALCRVFDNNKIKTCVPDFKATVSLESGLRRIKEYIDNHEESKQIDDEFDKWCDMIVEKMNSLI